MTTRQACLLLAFAGPVVISACTKDDKKPATDTGVSDTTGSVEDTADAVVAKCITNPDDLIADFTTDSNMKQIDGRSGVFNVRGDDSIAGSFNPPKQLNYPIDPQDGNPECSALLGSFHTKATGFGVWGAAVVADFIPKTEAGANLTYDASKYKGVSFWAKAGAPLHGIQVSFPDVFTNGSADPSIVDPSVSACVYSSMQPDFNCSPYLVKFGLSDFPNYQNMQIDTNWKRFDIMFADTAQDNYNKGYHTAADVLDTQHLTGMTIQVNANYDATGAPSPNDFEIWIDDINFIR
jgi:hypothetical protein